MQWLILNMWMILATVAVFAILFGWSVRGLFSSSSVRRAEIEREIVQTELNQTRAEVEALYQAQRKNQQGGSDASEAVTQLQAELSARDGKIDELERTLAAAQAENETLSQQHETEGGVLPAIGGAIAGAVAGSVLTDRDAGDADALKNLEDRNAWLETRVSELETTITESAETATQAAVPESEVSSEKLQWQAGYLRQRVDALEATVLAQRQAAPAPAAADTAEPAPDEDMARLRWRNRYLEGRLAYYEEQNSDIGNEDRTSRTEVQSLLDPDDAPTGGEAALPEDVPAEPASPSLLDAQEPDATHPSDAMLAEMDDETSLAPVEPVERVQPNAEAKPSNNGDDLTLIDGIGPKIAEVLNSLGIWTHAQIAAWTPANEAWIDDHLAFQGRVARENWVAQAVKFGAEEATS